MEWKDISHSHLHIRGINLHIAHIGKGELGAVVFLHGFPEIWYSWRYQMIAVAEAGFQAIALDLRGFGLSDQPLELEEASWEDLTDDLLALLDSLGIPKPVGCAMSLGEWGPQGVLQRGNNFFIFVGPACQDPLHNQHGCAKKQAFIVGKDFGAKPVFDFCIHHPDRVIGAITLGVPFSPKISSTVLEPPKGFYTSRWREQGRAEADFGRFDTKTVLHNIYILFSGSELPIAKEDEEIMDLVDTSAPLPSWLSEDDLQVYTNLYEKSGFSAPMQIPYRSFHKITECANPKVDAPSLLIMGEDDYILKFSGMEDYIKSGTVKNFVPNLEFVSIPKGTHFVQEQFPDQVNQLIVKFLKNNV